MISQGVRTSYKCPLGQDHDPEDLPVPPRSICGWSGGQSSGLLTLSGSQAQDRVPLRGKHRSLGLKDTIRIIEEGCPREAWAGVVEVGAFCTLHS